MKVVLIGISDKNVIATLQAAGHTTELLRSMCPEEEMKRVLLNGADAVIIDSATKLTADVIGPTGNCGIRIVAVAGITVENIDLDACTQKGWMVANVPDGYTKSVAEFTIAQLLTMARHVAQAHASMVAGKWNRKLFMGKELRGSTLGIVGFGRIGRRVAQYAKAMGMKVVAADPFVSKGQGHEVGVNLLTIDEVIGMSDFVSVHASAASDSEVIITSELFAKFPKKSYFICTSSGGSFDEAALVEGLNSGRIAGAAVDTFAKSVAEKSPLRKCKNLLLTSHAASGTVDAMECVLRTATQQVVDVLRGHPATHSVNVSSMGSEVMGPVREYVHIAEKLGYLAAALAGKRAFNNVLVDYSGTLATKNTAPLTTMVLKGVLSQNSKGGSTPCVNFVNAAHLAQQRGIRIRSATSKSAMYASKLEVKITLQDGTTIVVGGTTVPGFGDRIVNLNGVHIDLRPEGHMLFTESTDHPGVLAGVCTYMAQQKINIATLDLGRLSIGGTAVAGLNLDRGLTEAEMAALLNLGLPIHFARAVYFPEGDTVLASTSTSASTTKAAVSKL